MVEGVRPKMLKSVTKGTPLTVRNSKSVAASGLKGQEQCRDVIIVLIQVWEGNNKMKLQ